MTYGYKKSDAPQTQSVRGPEPVKQPEALIAAQELSNAMNLLAQSVDVLDGRLQDVMENAPQSNGICDICHPEMLSPIGRAMMEKAQQLYGLNGRLQEIINRLAI